MLMLAVAPDATITTPVSPVLMYDEDTSIRDKVMLESDTCTPPMKGILMDFWILGSWRGVMEERASSIRRSFTKTRPFSEMIAEMKPEPSDRIWGAAGIVVRRERRRKRRRRGGAMVLMFGGEEGGGKNKEERVFGSGPSGSCLQFHLQGFPISCGFNGKTIENKLQVCGPTTKVNYLCTKDREK